MADELKRVGLVFKADGTIDFKKSLDEINQSTKENRTNFKLAKAQWDESTSSLKKLQDRQEYLAKQTSEYSGKVKLLQEELTALESAESRDEKAIRKKKDQLTEAKTSLANYEKGLKDVDKQIKSGTATLEDEMKKTDEAIGKVNSSIGENESAFKLAESQWKKNTSVSQKLRDEQEYLAKQSIDYTEKVDLLTHELELLESAEEKDEKAIADKRSELNRTKSELNDYQKQLDEVNKGLKNGSAQMEEYAKKVKDIGDEVSSAGEAITKKVTVPIIAVGTAGIAAAKELDNGYDTIITKTGASSDALEEMQDIANEIYTSMKASMDEVGVAVGEVNTRFHSTGSELKNLSEDFLKFADINETDLNSSIDNTDAVMKKFNVDVGQTGNVLGLMTKVGQDTGLSMETLQSELIKSGSTLKEMDLNLVESVNLLAQFETSGVDSATALAGLKKAQQNATKEGKTLAQALTETIEDIKNAGSETEALQKATELFGAKGAAEMTQAIKEGRFNIEDLSASLSDYKDVVNNTFEETLDPWDKATVATNNLKLAGAELGTELLDELVPIIDQVVGLTQEFTTWFSNLDEEQKEMIIKIGLIVAAIGPMIIGIGKLIGGISGIIGFIPKITGGLSLIGSGAKALWGIIAANPVIAIIAAIIAIIVLLYTKCEWFRDGVHDIIGGITGFFEEGYELISGITSEKLGRIKEAYEDAGGGITGIVAGTWQALEECWTLGFDVIDKLTGGKLSDIVDKFSNMIESAKDTVKNGIEKIKDFFDFDWELPKIKLPHFKIDGEFSLVPPKTPRFSIDWYANGGILNKPTIFGANGSSLVGGGEAGKEAVLPIDILRTYIREENKNSNSELLNMLLGALEQMNFTVENNIEIGGKKFYGDIVKYVLKEIKNDQSSKNIVRGVIA